MGRPLKRISIQPTPTRILVHLPPRKVHDSYDDGEHGTSRQKCVSFCEVNSVVPAAIALVNNPDANEPSSVAQQ